MNISDTIDNARWAFELAGRGCLVRIGEDEPRYATVADIAAQPELYDDATMLVTDVSQAVGVQWELRHPPARRDQWVRHC